MKARYLPVFMLIAIAVCNGQDNSSQKEIAIGALVTLTGDWASNGEHTKVALEQADEDVNEFLGGIGSDKLVVLVIEDTQSDSEIANEKLKALAGQGIDIIIAAVSSQELQAMKGFADANDVLLIGTSSTAPSLSIPGDNIFRLVTDDVLQGKITAELLAQENISAVIPISRGDLWGDELLNATAESFAAKGGTAVEGVRYETNLTDYSMKVEMLSARVEEASDRYGPENVAVYLVSFDEAVPIMVLASKDPVLSSVRWFGSDGMAELPALVENESAAAFAARSKLIAPVFSPNDSNKLFAKISKDIQDEVGSTPDAYGVLAYDAFWIAALTELLADDGNASQEKMAFVQMANLFSGATGETKLNDAGDREFADYSLLSVKEVNGTYAWQRVGFFSTNYTTSWDFERMD